MPEDKPDKVVYHDDIKFDAWLEQMERNAKARAAKARVMRAKQGLE